MANYYTTFSVTEKECMVIHLRSQKNIHKIESSFTVPFPLDKEEDAAKQIQRKGEALKAALKEHNLRPGESLLLIPKHYVTVRHAFLPSVEDPELRQMAKFEAEKHIHFNVGRHTISHHIMKKEGVSGSHVLISAADSLVIDEPLAVLSAAGIHPGIASVSAVALYNLFRYLYQDLNEETTYALVHIGYLTIDLVIIFKGILYFTRSTSDGLTKLLSSWNELPDGGSSITLDDLTKIDLLEPSGFFSSSAESETTRGSIEPFSSSPGQEVLTIPAFPSRVLKEKSQDKIKILSQWTDKIVQSIRQTYDFARREFDCPPIEKIYISGEGTRFLNMTSCFSKNLGVEVDMVQIPGSLAGAESLPASFFPLLGAALEFVYEGGIHLNLLPEHFVEQQKSRQKKQNILSLGVMILGVIILGFLYGRAYSIKQEHLSAWYNKEIEALKPQVAQLAYMKKIIDIISRYIKDERNALAILDRISLFKYVPRQVSITRFVYKQGDYTEISGYALSIKDLNDFVKDLEETKFFQSVEIKQRPWRDIGNNRPKVLEYTLYCPFKGVEK